MKKLGLDLDNTIILYDKLFKKIAVEEKLVSTDIEPSKIAVRNHLRAKGRDEDFTILQSIVYGKRILEAELADGFKLFLEKLDTEIEVYIISHKTKFPIKGEKINLHEAAINFLEMENLIGNKQGQIIKSNIYFEKTISEKINRINSLNCDYFIDDLPEILNRIEFRLVKIFYNPNSTEIDKKGFNMITHWNDLDKKITI